MKSYLLNLQEKKIIVDLLKINQPKSCNTVKYGQIEPV